MEIRLETDTAAPAPAAAPADPAPAASPPADPDVASSGDFWDGFHAEEQEAGIQPPIAAEALAAVAAADIRIEDPEDAEDTEEPVNVGGWGSGLFTEDEAEPAYPPAFGGSEESAASGDRSWSYYEDDEEATEDRGWSYDDPVPDEESDEEEAPAFRSPAADREELVEKSSRFKDMTSWRPSMPSFGGGSSIGMRARDALEVLDAILEENGTEDIPRSFLVGLLGLVGVLALIALIAFIF